MWIIVEGLSFARSLSLSFSRSFTHLVSFSTCLSSWSPAYISLYSASLCLLRCQSSLNGRRIRNDFWPAYPLPRYYIFCFVSLNTPKKKNVEVVLWSFYSNLIQARFPCCRYVCPERRPTLNWMLLCQWINILDSFFPSRKKKTAEVV